MSGTVSPAWRELAVGQGHALQVRRGPADVTGTVYPGSESGTFFPTNRPCRLLPAHQGMKIGGTHSSSWIPAFAGMTIGGPDWRRDAANGE